MQATGTTYVILSEGEELPSYLPNRPETESVSSDLPMPDKTEWVTLVINAGKRDKLSKGDIVGYLFQKGRLLKDELGLVEVMHAESFAAVKRSKAQRLLSLVENETLKRKKVVVSINRQ
jgi:ATP-independent RNA helicase DbpA